MVHLLRKLSLNLQTEIMAPDTMLKYLSLTLKSTVQITLLVRSNKILVCFIDKQFIRCAEPVFGGN